MEDKIDSLVALFPVKCLSDVLKIVFLRNQVFYEKAQGVVGIKGDEVTK